MMVLIAVIKEGLSPRGRGNHPCLLRQTIKKRSIPAWAGEPRCR